MFVKIYIEFALSFTFGFLGFWSTKSILPVGITSLNRTYERVNRSPDFDVFNHRGLHLSNQK